MIKTPESGVLADILFPEKASKWFCARRRKDLKFLKGWGLLPLLGRRCAPHEIRSTHVKRRMDRQRPQSGTVLTEEGQVAVVVRKLVCGSAEPTECPLFSHRCELGVVFRTTAMHTFDPLNVASFRLQARPGQGDF